MSSYKVAQDVEADDKLLGPFTFRQFIYLIIVAMAGGLAYVLGKLLLPLAIIPLPFILFFGALALPLRKDQPMETYIAALISFYLKPRKRLWHSDGVQSLVEITVPKTPELSRTKDLSQNEAEKRLSYLADIADTRGWSVRNASAPVASGTSMVADVYNDSINTEDILDSQSLAARSFDTMINAADQKRRAALLNSMKQSITSPTPAPSVTQQPHHTAPVQATPPPVLPPDDDIHLDFNPYPASMQQSIIKPLSEQQAKPTPVKPAPKPATSPKVSTSANSVSPDIINLANNRDLSIETIAREAGRIENKRKSSDDEVVISLR